MIRREKDDRRMVKQSIKMWEVQAVKEKKGQDGKNGLWKVRAVKFRRGQLTQGEGGVWMVRTVTG